MLILMTLVMLAESCLEDPATYSDLRLLCLLLHVLVHLAVWCHTYPFFFSEAHKALSMFSSKGSGQLNDAYFRTRCLSDLSDSRDLVFIYHEATNSLFVHNIMTSDGSNAYCLLHRFLSHTDQI